MQGARVNLGIRDGFGRDEESDGAICTLVTEQMWMYMRRRRKLKPSCALVSFDSNHVHESKYTFAEKKNKKQKNKKNEME